jgi:hypothetical protein
LLGQNVVDSEADFFGLAGVLSFKGTAFVERFTFLIPNVLQPMEKYLATGLVLLVTPKSSLTEPFDP